MWAVSAPCETITTGTTTPDPKLTHWLKNNVSATTGLPLSFYVPEALKDQTNRNFGPEDSLTAIIERLIVKEGISIYDAALWQITLSTLGTDEDLKTASSLDDIYYHGTLRDLRSIRTGYPNQPFIYDPKDPQAVASDLTALGRRGFLFRIINADGKYNTADPLDGKTRFRGFPTWPTVHWEDWKPIAGENAWVVIAAMHLYYKKYFDPSAGAHDPHPEATELKLAEELARAATLLQTDNGGIRMAPLGTYYHLLDVDDNGAVTDIQRQLDTRASSVTLVSPLRMYSTEDFDFNSISEEFKWHYNEISTENNLSWHTAFKMLYAVTGKEAYLNAVNGIERYLKTVWNADGGYFYQGMHFTEGQWVPNTQYFATDCQTWGIAKLGPATIDAWFGPGSAYRMWQKTRDTAGAFDTGDRLVGVGFTKEHDRVSIEWTAGAVYAAKALARHYAPTHPDWSAQARADARSMREGIENYRFEISDTEAAYAYSSRRKWIPFGWFSHENQVLSLVSTCWVVLLDEGFDPFTLPKAPVTRVALAPAP